MTTLTLPIVVGKKYVRRDGKVILAAEAHHSGRWVLDADGDSYRTESGCFYELSENHYADLVSDYIEPAKGHPHAASMAQFAEDASKSETPCDGWQWKRVEESGWRDCEDMMPTWSSWLDYRRKPTVTPDPHAENAAAYAKDMAVSDKAWEGWQAKGPNWNEWQDLAQHPSWYADFQYRRRPL